MTNWSTLRNGKDFTFKACPGCGHSSFVVEESYCACADDNTSGCSCRYAVQVSEPDARFCADTGLYFSREENGSVRIDISQPGEHDLHVRVTQSTWASILEHVSLGATFTEAEKLHGFVLRIG